MTALHKAAEHDTSYMMNCLLESLNTLVPDPDKRLELLLQQTTAFRDTALHKAAEHDTSYVMNCLLESLNTLVPDPAKCLELLKQTDKSGETALAMAIRSGNTGNADLLKDTDTALSRAVRLKEIEDATRSIKFTDEQSTAATQWVTSRPNACRKIDKKQNENAK